MTSGLWQNRLSWRSLDHNALYLDTSMTRCSKLQVRAQNLQELVYKQGSAGITKATVSIVFHNNDPANGPSGYEDKEYITVTRQVMASAKTQTCQAAAALPM